jgi:hypothetical protein
VAFDPTSISNLINSPPGQFAAGAVLAGIVWKFFEKVESILKNDTKLEIAVWLLGVKPFGPKMEPWPGTFAKLFDRLFGHRPFSFLCFRRSALLSLTLYVVFYAIVLVYQGGSLATIEQKAGVLGPQDRTIFSSSMIMWLPLFLCVAIIGDYFALLETRFAIAIASRYDTTFVVTLCIVCDAIVTVVTASVVLAINWGIVEYYLMSLLMVRHRGLPTQELFANVALFRVFRPEYFSSQARVLWFYPSFFTCVWLWLYAGSGFLLKCSRHFDIGFQWFNSKADIEKHPLSAIGLVAGCIVALLWWTVVLVKWLV